MEILPYIRKVHFYETDRLGIVHNSNYVKWFEETRFDIMDQFGFSYFKLSSLGIELVLLGLDCEYRSMVRFGDTVSIDCKITLLNNKRLSMLCTATDLITGDLRATGGSRHCYYDTKLMKTVSLEERLPELYSKFAELYESGKI